MQGTGIALAAIGILVLVLALIRHFVDKSLVLGSVAHASSLLGVLGLLLLLAGGAALITGRRASA
ncbi:MAG: hypothetical protein ACR2PL_08950 [Dehalococcoidia bacterium]